MKIFLENEDKVISCFLKSIGPWNEYVVIGGGYAPIIYKLYFDSGSGNPPVGTRDLDSLIPRKIPATSIKDIAKHLKDSGFNHVFKDNGNPPTEAYLKEVNGQEVEVEFLTDNAAKDNSDKNVLIAGITAQPLSYLKLSLQNTISFKTQSGEVGKVVSPAAWVFHKGLTFPRRKEESKYYKDLYGIWYVASQIGKISKETREELRILRSKHPAWDKTFIQNLKKWVRDASPADWKKLELQNPFGLLKRLSFETLINELV